MEEWKNGRVEERKNGRLEECEDGRIYHGDMENTEMEGNADWRLATSSALCSLRSALCNTNFKIHKQ